VAMRIVFMGTPDLAVSVFERLLATRHQVVGAFCQPDKAKGRCLTPTPPPVKACALDHGIQVWQPKALRSKSLCNLEEMAPDLIVVAAYGKLLPRAVLELPRFGCVNVHASLLPAYRGAAPIQWAIANGEAKTGVCLMQMDEGLDTGAVLAVREVPIAADETGESLHDRLADVGGELLVENLDAIEAGLLTAVAQDHAQATWAPMLCREDGRIDWTWARRRVIDRVRGFHPWPGTFCTFRDKTLKLYPHLDDAGPEPAEPGTILAIEREGVVVGCGDGRVRLRELQLQGKKRMAAFDFANGARLEVGEKLN
jgi:methionyl-tRNA formyltransferase